MDFTNSLFLGGVIIGLGVSAPIGPIAIFIVRQTLTFGLASGLAAGLSTMISKGFYAWIAAFLASLVKAWLDEHYRWFYLLSGGFLMYIGIKVLMSHIQYSSNDKKNLEPSLMSSFLHTLVLTFISPMTTILFLSLFNSMGIFGKLHTGYDVTALVLGVMIGTIAWWTLLTTVVSTVQKKYDLKIFKYINLVSGIAIILYSLFPIGKSILGIQ